MKSFYQFHKMIQEQGMPAQTPMPTNQQAQPQQTGNAVSPPEGIDPVIANLQKITQQMTQNPQFKQLAGTITQAVDAYNKQAQAQAQKTKQQPQQQPVPNQPQQKPMPQPPQNQPQQNQPAPQQ